MKIYTKKGDQGQTSLIGGTRVKKNNIRIEAYGTVDELNAHVGLVRDTLEDETEKALVFEIQNLLFTIGSQLAADPDRNKMKLPDLEESHVEHLEKEMDKINEKLPALTHFILPGGHPFVSHCHIARTICRRAERKVVALANHEEVNPLILKYLNRLSDYLFMLSRKISQDMNVKELIWAPKK